MALALAADPPPRPADPYRVVRVAGTRATLDTVVGAVDAGGAPKEIALRDDPLPPEDVYSVLGYDLRQRAEVDADLSERQAEAEAPRPSAHVRARLLARRERGTVGGAA